MSRNTRARMPVATQLAQNSSTFQSRPFSDATAKRQGNAGLPSRLKDGIERLSGLSMDDVRVHLNSSKPAQLNALAFAQGTNVHIAPGQERHLGHEAWHVVQQKQGRVKAMHKNGSEMVENDDMGLEREADKMSELALHTRSYGRAICPATCRGDIAQLAKRKSTPAKGDAREEGIKEAFSKTYTASQASSSVLNMGGGPDAEPFVVRPEVAGGLSVENASNHHIYPKAKLVEPAQELSKWQIALRALKKPGSAAEQSKVTSLMNAVTKFNRRIGIKDDGSANPDRDTGITANYYWIHGLIFVGINSGYRTDDPSSKEEPHKPRTMDKDRFEAATNWGRNMVAMPDYMKNLATDLTDENRVKVESRLESNKELWDKVKSYKELFQTSQQIGEDWTLPDSYSIDDFLKVWGRPVKHYSLNTKAHNAFWERPEARNILRAQEDEYAPGVPAAYAKTAQHIAGRIRTALNNEAWATIKTATLPINPQLAGEVDQAYSRATSREGVLHETTLRNVHELHKKLEALDKAVGSNANIGADDKNLLHVSLVKVRQLDSFYHRASGLAPNEQ